MSDDARRAWRPSPRGPSWSERADRHRAAVQQVGYGRRLADVAGHDLTPSDVLAALNDTGLLLVVDADDLTRDAYLLLAVDQADPLDLDTAADAIDSHWDREEEDRDAHRLRRGDHDPGGPDE